MNLTNTQIHRLSEILKATEAVIQLQIVYSAKVWIDFYTVENRIETIQASISDVLGINEACFFEKIKTAEASFAKHCLWYYLKKYTNTNYSEIAKRYKKNHSTIILGIRSYTNLITLYDEYAAKDAAVEEAIKKSIKTILNHH